MHRSMRRRCSTSIEQIIQYKQLRKPATKEILCAFNLNIIKGSNPFCTKIFELLALILYPENRQFESPESKYMKVHAQIGREPFLLICGQGTWRYHRIWISNEWFRLF